MRTDGEAELGSMGRMITWLLTERLAVIPGMRVIAESTVRRQMLESMDLKHAGERLGVAAVLAGELTRKNGGFLLQFELIDPVDGALIGGAMIERAWQASVPCE